MSKSLLIIGAGGFGRSVKEAAVHSERWQDIFFVDDSYSKAKNHLKCNILGSTDLLESIHQEFSGIVVAIGNNQIREDKINHLIKINANLTSVYHPRSYVSDDACVGLGTLVMAGAVIGAYASVGIGCILNPNAVADHDSVMEDFSHLGVGANLAGTAVMKKGSWLRAGVSASYNQVVPEWKIIEPSFIK